LDIEAIVEYLSGFSENIALSYYEYIDECIKSLSTMPKRCPLVRNEELKAKGYRWVSVRNYTVFFIVDDDTNTVRINRVLYSKREYDVLL
jgi:plasmid stabilization system protein ParE